MGGQDVKGWEVYKGKELPSEGDREKKKEKRETRTRVLREESE